MFQKMGFFLDHLFKTGDSSCDDFYCTNSKEKQTPTYVFIAKDLENKNEQIFEAAVYYLCTIALHKTNYQTNILSMLNTYAQKASTKANRRDYIQKMMIDCQLSTEKIA